MECVQFAVGYAINLIQIIYGVYIVYMVFRLFYGVYIETCIILYKFISAYSYITICMHVIESKAILLYI